MAKNGPFRITRTVEYTPMIGFWEGFHFELGASQIALIQVFLTQSGHEDTRSMSFSKYRSVKHLSFKQAVENIRSVLAKMTFEHHRKQVVAKKLTLLGTQRAPALAKLLERSRATLRGMGEGTVIICDSGSHLLTSGSEGYIPSVPTARVTYPNARYRDGDLGDILVESGNPEVESGYTREEKAYPTKFKLIKKPPRGNPRHYWFAVEYQTRKLRVRENKNGTSGRWPIVSVF